MQHIFAYNGLASMATARDLHIQKALVKLMLTPDLHVTSFKPQLDSTLLMQNSDLADRYDIAVG